MYKSKKQEFSALGINIYGGGFTLSMLKHFSILAQWEEVDLGAKTFDMNFTGIDRPLNLADWNTKEMAGKVDVIYANPPCTPWSTANTRPGHIIEERFKDPRLDLTKHTMEAALKIKPTIFISESVENAYNYGVEFYNELAKPWLKAGYAVTFFLNDAVLQGSPSVRRRFHFIAHKVKLQLGQCPQLVTPVTVRDAIGDIENAIGSIPQHDLEKLNPYYGPLMAKVVPGGRLRDVVRSEPGYEGPSVSFLIKRFIYDNPSHTMVGFGFIHPNGKRWITKREALRLCTYPDDFMCKNAQEAVDAVLPIVGDFLGQMAKKSLKKNEPCEAKLSVIDWREAGAIFHPRNYEKRTGIKCRA